MPLLPFGSAPTITKETIGEKLRRCTNFWGVQDTWKKPYKYPIPGWQPNTLYQAYSLMVNAGGRFVCVTGGTSASTGNGPTNQGQGSTTDGTISWIYKGTNSVTNSLSTTIIPYSNTLAVTAGQIISTVAGFYFVIYAGTTSATGAGPTGTSTGITDGTATFSFYGSTQPVPYDPDYCLLSYASNSPDTNIYDPTVTPNGVGAISTKPIAGGSGYAVNDTITIAGGTSSVAVVLTVTAVTAGLVTAASIKTAGTYTALPPSVATQASTSGSGTGATFAIKWPAPLWCNLRGCYNGGNSASSGSSGNAIQGYNFTPTPNSAPWSFHGAMEFYTDAIRFSYLRLGHNNSVNIIVDGIRIWETPVNSASGSTNWQTLDFTLYGGRKRRHVRIESTDNALGAVSCGSSSSVWAVDDLNTITAVAISDSIFAGNNFSPFMVGGSIVQRLGHQLGWRNFIDMTQSGTGYIAQGDAPGVTSNTYGVRCAEAASYLPDVIMFMGSENDYASVSSVQAAALACFQTIRSISPKTIIIAFGVLPFDTTLFSNVAALENAVGAAVTQFNDSLTYFIPLTTQTGDQLALLHGAYNNAYQTTANNYYTYINTVDSEHPSDSGVETIVDHVGGLIRRYVLGNII